MSDVAMPVMISPRLQEQRESMAALPKRAPRQQTTAPASPPPAANTVSPQQWQSQVLAQLDRRKVYPRAAQADGVQGSVGISFSVSASGQITAVSIARSSGSPVLDQAALDTARRASPLPTPPAGYANRSITATIRFSLR
ncbi:energy transducer TonB [Devosia sp. 2618]|uniref:energy transducer TonB family protein n=1 Tax=Devosia sp. 2618 TaxID=3156454 RepID=UPI0033988BE4